MSKINSKNFNKNNLKYLQKYTNLDTEVSSFSNFYLGDVTGNEEKEIVLISKNTISIFSLNGKLIKKKTFDEMNFGTGILADIDNDSKQDIIIGAARSKGVNIMVYSGVLEPEINFLYSDIYNAETKIHFYHDGDIYFSTKSTLHTPPKIVGAFNPSKEEISWNYYTGPAPLDIAANNDLTKLTISNTPANLNGLTMDEDTVADHSKFRNSIYVLDKSGNPLTQISIGPEYRSGEFTDGGISSVTERLCDIDNDGTDELLVGINRISDFYQGNAALELRSLDGKILNRKEFLPNTEIEFSFFDTRKGKNIAVLLKQKGFFYILDKNLSILSQRDMSNLNGEFTLQESGDYNGDGLVEHLVTVGNRLFIFNSKLEILFSSPFLSFIKNASFTIDKNNNPILIVQSNKIDILKPGKKEIGYVSVFTDPPGADIFVDGEKLTINPVSGVLSPFPPGKLSFQAKMDGFESKTVSVTVKAGKHITLDLKLENFSEKKDMPVRQPFELDPIPAPAVPVRKWEDIHLLRTMNKNPEEILIKPYLIDLAGDSSKDLLFRSAEDGTYKTYNLSMQLLSQFQLPYDYSIINVELDPLDPDRNSKTDLLVKQRYNEGFSIITSQGKVLYSKIIGRFPESVFGSGYLNKNNNLYFSINSGYSQQPRGMIGINFFNDKINFFSPTAAAPIRLIMSPENILLASIHTPTNGAVIQYPNGDIAKDSEYYIYMTDLRGNHLDTSFNPEFKDNNGILQYYLADLNMDNEKETYMVANKTNYYTGRSKIVRINMIKGTISRPLFTSEPDVQIYMHSVLKKDFNNVLAIYLRKPRILYFLSQNFDILKTINIEDKGLSNNWLFPDLNGDGTSEMIIWDKKGFSIYDLELNILLGIETKTDSGDLKRLLLNDIDSDGKDEIILISDNSVSVYGY